MKVRREKTITTNRQQVMYSNLVKSFNCDQGAIRKVHFSKEGEYRITAGVNKRLKPWNTRKGLLLYCRIRSSLAVDFLFSSVLFLLRPKTVVEKPSIKSLMRFWKRANFIGVTLLFYGGEFLAGSCFKFRIWLTTRDSCQKIIFSHILTLFCNTFVLSNKKDN